MTMAGVSVDEHDVRGLVTSLVSDGTPQALFLANRIATCLDMNASYVELDPLERGTLLDVLCDPPDSLVELRGALARDHGDRA